MPPQRDETDAVEDHAVPSTETPKAAENTSETSYWDTPEEGGLKGKRLSALELSALAANNLDKKTEQQDNYWEAPEEEKLKGKRLSTLDMTTLEHVEKAQDSSPKSITAEEPDDSTPSYWDEKPIDKSLQGKRLSTLDMSALATNNPDKEQEKQADYWGDTPKESEVLKGKTLSTLDMTALESNNPDQHQKKRDDYWEAPEEATLKGKRLSALELSALEANNLDKKTEQQDNYWEAPEEEKLKGKRLSTIDMKTLEHVEPSSNASPITATEDSGPASYWDEAPIDESLKNKRLSAIDMASMTKQRVDDDKKKESSTPYWEWHGVKALKKTLSKLSLSNLRKGSAHDVVLDDECVHGGSNGKGSIPNTDSSTSMSSIDSNNSNTVKPITNKKHKLRDSWRKSFQRLSTNTLDQLDESTGSGPRLLGKRMFKTSKNPLDWSTGSRSSQASIGEDAIMF